MKILAIDAWAGSEPNTWDWNNWYNVGECEAGLIKRPHKEILAWFRENGFLEKGAGLNRCYIEDDRYNFVIKERKTDMPLYAIEYGSEEN